MADAPHRDPQPLRYQDPHRMPENAEAQDDRRVGTWPEGAGPREPQNIPSVEAAAKAAALKIATPEELIAELRERCYALVLIGGLKGPDGGPGTKTIRAAVGGHHTTAGMALDMALERLGAVRQGPAYGTPAPKP